MLIFKYIIKFFKILLLFIFLGFVHLTELYALENIKSIDNENIMLTSKEGDDSIGLILPKQIIVYNWKDSAWVNSAKWIFVYDSLNFNTEKLYQKWGFEQWTNSMRWTYKFNPNGLIYEEISERWENENWIFSDRITNYYHDNLKIRKKLSRTWVDGEWKYHSQDTFLLNNLGQNSEWISKIWNNGQWENYFKIEYNYNKDGMESENNYFKWTSSAWEPFRRVINDYRSVYLKDSTVTFSFVDSVWIFYALDKFNYDNQNRLDEWNYQIWEQNRWKNIWKQIYSYNSNSSINEIFLNVWKDNSWASYSKRVYDYSRVVTSNNETANLQTNQLKLNMIYDKNDLFLQIESGYDEDAYYELFDLMGGVITKSPIVISKGISITQIPSANLSSGLYFLGIHTKQNKSMIKFTLFK